MSVEGSCTTNDTYNTNTKTHREPIGRVTSSVVPLQPPPAEGQSAEGLGDVGEQLLGGGQAQRYVRRVEVLHVVRAVAVLHHPAAASRAWETNERQKVNM